MALGTFLFVAHGQPTVNEYPPPPSEVFEKLGSPIPENMPHLRSAYGDNPTYLDRIPGGGSFVAGVVKLETDKRMWCIMVPVGSNYDEMTDDVQRAWRVDFQSLATRLTGQSITFDGIYQQLKAVGFHNIEQGGWTFGVRTIPNGDKKDGIVFIYMPSQFAENGRP